jgi:PAS domain S-box-containing protein
LISPVTESSQTGAFGEPMIAIEELARLRSENDFLMRKVSALASVERQLAASRHQLDVASRRFGRMQTFMRRGMLTESREELARICCEAIVDILECEIGLLWCLTCPQGPNSFFLSPGNQLDAAAREILLDWTKRRTCGGHPPAAVPLPDSLGWRDWLVEEIRDEDGEVQGLLIAANSWAKGAFYDTLDETSGRSFAAFGEQVGALMEKRRWREATRTQIQRNRLSEERLNLVLDSSNVGLWDFDYETQEVFYSEQFKKQLGYSGKEISNRFSEWEDRIHPADRDQALEVLWRFKNSKSKTYENSFRLRNRSGRWRWILARGVALRDESGKPLRIIGIHIDLTSFKQLEEKLRNAKSLAERASKAKSGFLAKVSHELRTPLNGMLGSLQLLQDTALDEEQRKLVDIGQSSGRWMLSIIGDGLDLARIEAGKLQLVSSPFSPQQLLSEIMTFTKANAAAKRLEFDWQVDPDIPEQVGGDATAVRQIFANLVGNAIKFTDHGSVRVKLDSAPGKQPGLVQLVLTVEDTGIGIPRALSKEIFKPFLQADPADSRRAGGIGLGLAVTRELVGLMGGSIRLERPRSQGTRFIVTMPVELWTERAQEPARPAKGRAIFSGRVLVVDDDPVSRELAAMMLRRMGVEADTAANGREGLGLLLGTPYDLALVECRMPELDGLEMTRLFRESAPPDRLRVPIIALTANTQQSDVDSCLAAGMDCYIPKTLIDGSLQQCLDRYLKPETDS